MIYLLLLLLLFLFYFIFFFLGHLCVGNVWIYDCSITAICTANVGKEH